MAFEIKKIPLGDDDKKVISEYGVTTTSASRAREDQGLSFNERMWKFWCDITKRPEDKTLTDYARDAVYSYFDKWSHSPAAVVQDRMLSALYIPIVDGGRLVIDYDEGTIDETEDVARLIDVLDDENVFKEARSIRSDIRANPVYFVSQKSFSDKLDILLEVFKAPEFDDLDYIDRKALTIVSSMNDEAFNSLVEKIKRFEYSHSHGDEPFGSLSPAEVIVSINGSSKTKIFNAKMRGLGVLDPVEKKSAKVAPSRYEAGRIEHEVLGDDMEVDLVASAMIDEGYNMRDVINFHNYGVPKGYWEHVMEYVESPDASGDPRQAYDALEKQFSFHPDKRIKPELR